MACHKHGMIRFKDTLSAGTAVGGAARQKLDELIPPPEKMDRLLSQDEKKFLDGADRGLRSVPASGRRQGQGHSRLPRAVAAIAMLYNKDITVVEAAFELGIAGPGHATGHRQAKLGAAQHWAWRPWASGEKIKRETWHSTRDFLSQFHRAANQMDVGTPHRQL